jgi:hypothetical protein
MKLNFIIDREYDEYWVKDPKVAKVFGYSKNILAKLGLFYDTSAPILEATKKMYQKSWNEINEEFSSHTEIITGYRWFYPKYECVVSGVHLGLSNWGVSPKIAVLWKYNPYFMRSIVAHELCLSHYFEIYKRRFFKEELSDGQIWALAEIAAFAIIGLTTDAKKWWPWDATYRTDHNYPHIVELQKKLKPAFLKRKSFDEYVLKGICLVRKYPDMGP